MKQAFLLTFLLISAGCATARLPQAPDIYSVSSFDGRPTVSVAKVQDLRTGTKVGTIGATSVKVKNDVADLTTNYLVTMLNSQYQLNVRPISANNVEGAKEALRNSDSKTAIVVGLTNLRLHSLDAIMQPVEVDADLKVDVVDAQGTVTLSKEVSGHYEKRIGLSIVDKSTGELVDRAIREAVSNLIKDEEIKNAIN